MFSRIDTTDELCRRCRMYGLCHIVFVLFVLNLFAFGWESSQLAAQDTGRSESESDISEAQVQKLILDLSENSRQVRVAAEKRLIEFGPTILPWLPEPDEDTDPNVRLAVERIRQQLELQEIVAIFKPSTFTLTGKLALQKVLQQLSERTGNVIDHSKLKDSTRSKIIDCKFQNTTFWNCVTQLTEDHKFSWIVEDQKLIVLPAVKSKTKRRLLETTSGAVHVLLSEGTTVDLPGSEFSKNWKAVLTLTVEPRLQPLAIRYASNDIEARSPKSKLNPFISGAKYDRVLSVGTRTATVPIQFLLPSNAGTDLTVNLKGTIDLVCASPNRAFDVSTRASSATFRTGSVTLNVDASSAGKKTLFAISAEYRDSPIQFESHFSSILPGAENLQLRTKTVPPLQASITGEGDTHHVTAAFNKVDVDQAEKLVVDRPVALRTVSVPFEFKGVKIHTKQMVTLPARESR